MRERYEVNCSAGVTAIRSSLPESRSPNAEYQPTTQQPPTCNKGDLRPPHFPTRRKTQFIGGKDSLHLPKPPIQITLSILFGPTLVNVAYDKPCRDRCNKSSAHRTPPKHDRQH